MGDERITAKVYLFGEIKDILGETMVRLDVKKNPSLRDVLEQLCRIYGPKLYERLFDSCGKIHNHMSLIVNGLAVKLDEIDLPIKSSAQDEIITEVFILPIYDGG